MFITKNCFTLLLLVGFVSYSLNSLADDGLTPGPGLFSGKSGEFNISNLLSKKANPHENASEREAKALDEPVEFIPTNRVAQEPRLSADNFSAYKEWRKLNKKNPELYESFEVWLEYQAYLNEK